MHACMHMHVTPYACTACGARLRRCCWRLIHPGAFGTPSAGTAHLPRTGPRRTACPRPKQPGLTRPPPRPLTSPCLLGCRLTVFWAPASQSLEGGGAAQPADRGDAGRRSCRGAGRGWGGGGGRSWCAQATVGESSLEVGVEGDAAGLASHVQHKDGSAASDRLTSAVLTAAEWRFLVLRGHPRGIDQPGPWVVRLGALPLSLSRLSRLCSSRP
eukprot:SAG22_NODE_11_length_35583_cov_107.128790_30_plen_214_part_00